MSKLITVLKLKKLLFSWNTDKLKINIQDLFNMVTKNYQLNK